VLNVRLRRSGTFLPWVFTLTAICLLTAGALVWTRTHITRLGYELSDLLAREAELRRDVEKLRIAAAVLADPERLERRGRRLGLTPPAAGQVIRLRLDDLGRSGGAGR
jgi:cell division protein FtsL